ncbi:MAG: phosphatidate cytidylyltransferase, partial [Oscillospiraceae bacterium]|nr:phosphatidate cytidylyltransferase [Oscillospiraceae bacterium]
MKARLIVAGIGIPLLLIVLLVLPTAATAVLIAAITAIGAYELLYAAEFVKNLRVLIVTAAMSVFVCFWCYAGMPAMPIRIAVFVFALYAFVELLLADTKLDFRNLCIVFFAGVAIPYLLSAITRIICMENGRYLVFVPFIMTMIPDTGAFLVGRKIGRHKLAPNISPKKSVEGLVGGTISGILGMLLYALILQLCGFGVNYLYAALYGVLGSFCSTIGDLVFSTI